MTGYCKKCGEQMCVCTTTKEDQPLSTVVNDYIENYELRINECAYSPNAQEVVLITDAIYGLLEDEEFKKSFSESYEKKLAEKDAAIAHYKNDQVLAADTERKLSEANARNAMLVEVLKTVKPYLMSGSFVTHDVIDKAISANSEAVAAWEAEKLEPLRMEVAILRDAIIPWTKYGNVGTRDIEVAKAISAFDNTQATAAAYDREVVDNYIAKLRNLPKIGLSERQFGELHAANKVKGE